MYAVINHLSLHKTVDWEHLSRIFGEFEVNLKSQFAAFRGCTLIRAGDNTGILVVTFDNLEALEDISKNVAAPWFAEHVRPLRVGAVSRSVGEVITGSALC